METEDKKPADEKNGAGNDTTTAAAAATAEEAAATATATTAKEEGDAAMADASAAPPKPKTNPADDLDPASIKTLTEEMGFALIRAQKGLLKSSGETVESAVEWLMEHQDDADIDDPIPDNERESSDGGDGDGVARSFRCVKTGKIFSSMANLELYANRTGYTDFEESTEEVKPLTPEEKAAKLLEIKALLKAKRDEREQSEKADRVDREKRRRFTGQEMAKTREEMEIEQRKRSARARKQEKIDQKRERERIRAELEKDKRERSANKGKLKGKLGVDGYAPSAIQYDQGGGDDDGGNDGGGGDNDGGEPKTQKPKTSGSAAATIDGCIAKVASYRAGGDGGKCLKVLGLLVGNASDDPTEEKFKSINTDTKTYRNKIKPFLGAKQLLLAVGFGMPERGGGGDPKKLVLKDDADLELLKTTKAKLQRALEQY